MAFTIGANDSANSWGTSVGSGAIKLRYAVLIGGFMEWLGAATLGYGVSDTIKKGVAPMDQEDCWACGDCQSKMGLYTAGTQGHGRQCTVASGCCELSSFETSAVPSPMTLSLKPRASWGGGATTGIRNCTPNPFVRRLHLALSNNA